jgi:hypothetical protein
MTSTPSSLDLPAQISDAAFSGPSLASPPSSRAWRLFLALIDHAGPENAAEAAHVIALDDLRARGVHFATAPDLLGLMGELRTASLTWGGEAFHLIDWASVLTVDDGRFLRWKWTDAVREAFAAPDGWAEMDREALRAMPRRYALRLYALAALRRSDRRHEDVFTIDQLRTRLGVPSGTLPASGSLVTTLRRAVVDVNAATGLRLAVRTIRRGRFVEAVEITWRGIPAFKRTDSAERLPLRSESLMMSQNILLE